MMSEEKFSNDIERGFASRVLMIAQIAVAIFLVNFSVILIILWMILAAISLFPNGGLMPWIASGVLLFGLFFIVFAAIPGIPGIILGKFLSRNISPPLSGVLKITVLVGEFSFKVGSIFAILALVFAIFR